MKRSLTQLHKKRIEQSSQSIVSDISRKYSQTLESDALTINASFSHRLLLLFRKVVIPIGAIAAFGIVLVAFTSCNVTRTITNQSQYYQRGDTSIVITTKTIETYDATKKL